MRGIRIEQLFGHFDYNIELADGGITILTGPNGFGKSTIIKCIRALSNSDVSYFFDLNFKEIEILMPDESQNLLIEKAGEELIVAGLPIDRNILIYQRRMLREDRRLQEPPPVMARRMENYARIMEYMKQVVGRVEYIQEQRLIRERIVRRGYSRESVGISRGERQIENIVEMIPENLLFKMRAASASYSRVANELDSTYPERLFNQIEGMEEQIFDEKMETMQQKVEKLNKYGISKIRKLQDVTFRKDDARALKIYFDDFEKKYREYEPLIEKLDLFTDMVNHRFKFKKIDISDEKGMVVVDENSKEPIKLSNLSSGEKETLVLFYQLLFEIPDNVMLLIDEPEISLHIAWQRMFANDLKKIVENKKLCTIVATHSPQIISGKHGIQQLIEAEELQDTRIVGIRDRDYEDIPESQERLFFYDTCCMETMLLSSEDCISGILDIYYKGSKEKRKTFLMRTMKELAIFSVIRAENEKHRLEIDFKRARLSDCLNEESEKINYEELFEKISQGYLILAECQEKAANIKDEKLLYVTNGHDICSFLGKILKAEKGDLGEKRFRDLLLSNYRKEDFKKTQLYRNLKVYQDSYQRLYVDE